MTEISTPAETAREAARTGTGQFGVQNRTAPDPTPATDYNALLERHLDEAWLGDIDEFAGYGSDPDFGGGGDETYLSELMAVRDALRGHYETVPDAPDFDIALVADVDGRVEMVNVEATFDMASPDSEFPEHVTLARGFDLDDSTLDTQATGREAALACAGALDSYFGQLIAQGHKLGLRAPRKYALEGQQ